MNVLDAKQILADFEENVEICYQDNNNINKYLPIKGFEVKHRRDGKKVLVLITVYMLESALDLELM